jgi:hypothetical protein
VWARNAKTEALLKAVVGAVGGAGLALAAGHWLVAPLSMAALPLAATVLALFFELDDNGAGRDKRRIAGARAKQRFGSAASSPELDELDEASDEPEHKLGKR